MKTILALCVLIALFLRIATAQVTAPAQRVPVSQPAGLAKGGELAALEKKLLGNWNGPPCAGDYTFNADGTYECRSFTPGGNTVTGAWSVRWDALPPTLVLMCKTSDFKKKVPTRPEYEYLGKPLELKLVELNGDAFVYRFPNDKGEWRNARPDEK
jgi:hypothetical protein